MDPSHSHQARFGQPSRLLTVLPGPFTQQVSPERVSFSSVRYSPLELAVDEKVDEKASIQQQTRLSNGPRPDRCQSCQCAHCDSSAPSASAPHRSMHALSPHHARSPSPYIATSSQLAASSWTVPTPAYTRPRGLRIANLLKPWIPIILYAITSLGFLAAISFYKVEVFSELDALSHWLRSDMYIGYAVICCLIFITTFPPIPLYSTLVILSGYTFGPWTGAILSYFSSLVGALAVFLLSRTFFRARIQRWLSCTITIKRVVRAIERRPRLLFLIRLAPYPYNVLNCLLAASPSLTLRTYTLCTALSLFKLIIHTSIGSSIHSFTDYHLKKPEGAQQQEDHSLARYSTIAGISLCVVIFFYISYVCRRAVDDELEDDETLAPSDSEERTAFLSAEDCDNQDLEAQMVESPIRLRSEDH